MNRIYSGIFIFAILAELSSCVKNIDLPLRQANEQVLVVDGQLTDLASEKHVNYNNYVRLTWARNTKETSVQPVDSALVIISSSGGERDTLVNERKVKTASDPREFQGYYYPTKLICSAGTTYSLEIYVQGKQYSAEAFMPPVTKIDSVDLVFEKNIASSFSGYFPFISFREPQNEKNYYLTQFCSNANRHQQFIKRLPCEWRGDLWNVSIMDDEYLPAYVKGLNVNVGTTPSPYNVGFVGEGDYSAYLYSLTPDAYAYYEALIKGLHSDGGVYAPAPANAPTNIKSKYPAAGFFNASSVSFHDFHVGPNPQ